MLTKHNNREWHIHTHIYSGVFQTTATNAKLSFLCFLLVRNNVFAFRIALLVPSHTHTLSHKSHISVFIFKSVVQNVHKNPLAKRCCLSVWKFCGGCWWTVKHSSALGGGRGSSSSNSDSDRWYKYAGGNILPTLATRVVVGGVRARVGKWCSSRNVWP